MRARDSGDLLSQWLELRIGTLLNRDLFGRRVQVLFYPRSCRRNRGFFPVRGPWPIFHYWTMGPLQLRVFSPESSVFDGLAPRRP